MSLSAEVWDATLYGKLMKISVYLHTLLHGLFHYAIVTIQIVANRTMVEMFCF